MYLIKKPLVYRETERISLFKANNHIKKPDKQDKDIFFRETKELPENSKKASYNSDENMRKLGIVHRIMIQDASFVVPLILKTTKF